MNNDTERELREIILNIVRSSYNTYTDWFPTIKSVKPKEVNLSPLAEIERTMQEIAKAYSSQMYAMFNKNVNQNEYLGDETYIGLATEQAENAIRDRDRLEKEAINLMKPILNLETDKENAFGWNKTDSEKVISDIKAHSMSGFSIFASKCLFSKTRQANPKIMRIHYKVQHIKEDILNLRKKHLLACFSSLDIESVYNLVCRRMIYGS